MDELQEGHTYPERDTKGYKENYLKPSAWATMYSLHLFEDLYNIYI